MRAVGLLDTTFTAPRGGIDFSPKCLDGEGDVCGECDECEPPKS